MDKIDLFPCNEFPNKKIINQILLSALDAVDPYRAVLRCVRLEHDRYLKVGDRQYDLDIFENIYIIGAGKGAQPMVEGLAAVLGERITGGCVIVKHLQENGESVSRVQFLKGNHPVPGIDSVSSTEKIVDFSSQFSARDLVVCVITGGGSALMSLPRKPVELEDLKKVTELLLASGAAIQEINTIRKHLDQVKGGGLASLVHPAELVTLILSDVIGNPMDIIASGPTVHDAGTFEDAIDILKHYHIWKKTPPAIRTLLQQGVRGEIPETVKEGDPCLQKIFNMIIGDNLLACRAARQTANELGFNSLILTTSLQGEARQAGQFLSSILREISMTSNPVARPACIIAGGETTVTIQGSGVGGRNQELALSAVMALAGLQDIALVTLATDGEDGPTDAAGALVTGETGEQASSKGMNAYGYLENNDSYHYFKRLGSLVKPGPTSTNVNDISFLFVF